MPTRPRIAVPVPTSADFEYNRRCWPDYAQAIHLSQGEAVEVPLGTSLSDIKALAATCDGIVLPGSPADVDPTRYGQQPSPACARPDPAREAVDLLLIELAATRRLPLLGICFGAQILNVSRGGTLLQDLTPLPVNHAAGPSVTTAHMATIDRSSTLGSILHSVVVEGLVSQGIPPHVNVPVNSSHHQAVGIPGAGLRVSARCPEDAVIEAIEGGEESFLVAVQWHPERNFAETPASRALFASLMKAAASR